MQDNGLYCSFRLETGTWGFHKKDRSSRLIHFKLCNLLCCVPLIISAYVKIVLGYFSCVAKFSHSKKNCRTNLGPLKLTPAKPLKGR